MAGTLQAPNLIKDNYDKLTYWDKTAICKLINKKQYLFGRALA